MVMSLGQASVAIFLNAKIAASDLLRCFIFLKSIAGLQVFSPPTFLPLFSLNHEIS